MFVTGHFRQRVAERCPDGTCPVALAKMIRRAIRKGRDDLVERVMSSPGADMEPRTIWRVKHPGGWIAYVVVADATTLPITLMTQEQMRDVKGAVRAKRPRAVHTVRRMVDEADRHARQRHVRLKKQGGLYR